MCTKNRLSDSHINYPLHRLCACYTTLRRTFARIKKACNFVPGTNSELNCFCFKLNDLCFGLNYLCSNFDECRDLCPNSALYLLTTVASTFLSPGTLLLTVADFELRTTGQYFFIKLTYLSLRATLFELYYALLSRS
jgi:hypothetical protein